MNHTNMRILLREAFARVLSRHPTQSEAQCLQAIAALESNYGTGWKPPGSGSNNFGAVQAGSNWTGDTFQYTDTRPNADGTSTPYVTRFRKYEAPIDGAVDLVKVVYQNRGREKLVLQPAGRGDTLGFSRGLHASGYFEGFGRTVDDRIANHHKVVVRSIRSQSAALHEGLPADIAAVPVARPTLKLGSTDRAGTREFQELLNRAGATPPLIADGGFGAKTDAAVRAFQRGRGLKVDGEVGPKTWGALIAALPFDTVPPDVA